MNGGVHSGRKLWPSLTVATQENRVLTNSGRPSAPKRDVVHVDIAGHPGRVRRVDGIEPRRRLVPAWQHVVEAVDLVLCREREAAAVGADAQAHAAREGSLEHRQPPVGPRPEQEQLARLIGGERQRRRRSPPAIRRSGAKT